jgi:hypothetical protein
MEFEMGGRSVLADQLEAAGDIKSDRVLPWCVSGHAHSCVTSVPSASNQLINQRSGYSESAVFSVNGNAANATDPDVIVDERAGSDESSIDLRNYHHSTRFDVGMPEIIRVRVRGWVEVDSPPLT